MVSICTYVNYLLLIPALVAFVGCFISTLILFGVYRERKFIELGWITAGFMIYAIHPFVFSLFSFLGKEFSTLRQILGTIQITAASFGFLLIWYALNNLSGEGLYGRKYWLVISSLFGLGYSANGFTSVWDPSIEDWVISYSPTWSVFLLAGPLFWIMLEILIITKKSLNYASDDNKGVYRSVFIGWFMGSLTIIVLIIERVIASNSALYLVFAALGFVIISLSLRKDPYALVPRTIKGQSLVISNRTSGVPVLIHQFKEMDEDSVDNSVLFSGAMKGILTLLNELTGREDLPESFGYVDYTIIIEKSNNYIAYFICYRSTNPVKAALIDILGKIENIGLRPDKIHSEEESELHQLVENGLYFAI
ncbi:MAG: hypothetical protein INQ03_20095 [Candidatus Heimdallarchaeota archaeon]|nr:hypothetical protein [Candidatus Heimdallarchaeota archaeon]